MLLFDRGRKRQGDPQVLQVDGLCWVDRAQLEPHWNRKLEKKYNWSTLKRITDTTLFCVGC